jgi:histone-lysine N-methyltransferase SETMAR
MSESQLKYRAVIEFLFLEGRPVQEIHSRLENVYKEDSPSLRTVYNWVREFRSGRKSLKDEPTPGAPKSVRTADIIAKVEERVMADRRMKLWQLQEELGIPKTSIYRILTEDLGMRKVSARWVPKLLTPVQKRDRVAISNDNLDLLNEHTNMLTTLVTGDETWVYYFDPETKTDSMQWKHLDSPPPKKAKVQKSCKKLMLTVFWDSKGPLLVKFHPRNTTINGPSYVETLKDLREALQEKRGVTDRQVVRLLHDNAPPHTCRVATAAVRDLNFELVNHPPYSPDLAPSDYYLFRLLKRALKGTSFSDDNELVAAVNSFFDSQEESFYSDGILCLNSKWEACVLAKGEYIEK